VGVNPAPAAAPVQALAGRRHQALADPLPPCCRITTLRLLADALWADGMANESDDLEAQAARVAVASQVFPARDHDPLTCPLNPLKDVGA
jgi:hypothetical protein